MTLLNNTKSPKFTKEKVVIYLLICIYVITIALSVYYTPSLLSFQSFLLKDGEFDEGIVVRERHEYMFSAYLKKYGKSYKGEQYHRRLGIFKESIKIIEELSRQSNGTVKYGFTKFSDMTQDEFIRTMTMDPRVFEQNGARYTGNYSCHVTSERSDNSGYLSRPAGEKQPLMFDWRAKGVVGPVLDQGHRCLSCWAYSVVGVMESMLLISHQAKHYSRLSIQELVDCSTETDHCSGGCAFNALEFLCLFHWPLVSEDKYPVTNRYDGSCRLKEKPKSGVMVSRVMYYNDNDISPDEIAEKIWSHGPVTAAVNAHLWGFYLDGVIQYHCSNEPLNHVVQIVGYDKTAPVPYFIVKNSWGTDWGIDGYVKISMKGGPGDTVCGIGSKIAFMDVVLV